MKIIRSGPQPFVLLIEDGKLVNCCGITSGYVKPSDLNKLIIAINNSIAFNTQNKLTDDIINELDNEAKNQEYLNVFGRKNKVI